MKWLYLLLDIGTLFFPVVLSFDKRVAFFYRWKTVLLSALIVSVPFLIWDYFFTEHGVWGFNPDYLCGIYFGNLPLEEVLFFFVVPFACTFIYECCKYYFRKFTFEWITKLVYIGVPVYLLILNLLSNGVGWYTLSVSISAPLVLIWLMFNKAFKQVAIAFLISLVPFLVVNGILTGGATPKPVVWYNELHKVSPRIWTIPMEDVMYSFTLIVSVILLHEFLSKKLQT